MGKTSLIAVCGLSPQVLTETLYALHQQQRLPQRVRVLTTRAGRDACLTTLFPPGDGRFQQFLADFFIEPQQIDFGPHSLIAVRHGDGREIEDITSEEDNEAFLKSCMRTVFDATQNPADTVYYSIAGGRKTMGACLSVAASCYGRSRDRLFHVLISPEFESSRNFFYPPLQSGLIELRDSAGLPYYKETRHARINLVSMPLISLRERLTEEHLQQPEDPATLLLSLVRDDKAELVINLAERKLQWKGIELDMPPAHLALYTYFAQKRKEQPAIVATQAEILEQAGQIARLYQRVLSARQSSGLSENAMTCLDEDNFQTYKSKINAAIRRTFGPLEGELLFISSQGRKPETRFVIALEGERIRILW